MLEYFYVPYNNGKSYFSLLMVKFNSKLKLVLADVDQTLAGVYQQASPEMLQALNSVLRSGICLFMISGGGLPSIRNRIADRLEPELRHRLLIAHCYGAEVWGYASNGDLLEKPFYSLYDMMMNSRQKQDFRKVISQLVAEFKLKTYTTMAIPEFKKISENDPAKIMTVDRGPQITLEMPNSIDLIAPDGVHYDLRDRVAKRASELFTEFNVPVEPNKGGNWSLDFKLQGVSKDTAIKYILEHDLSAYGYDLGLTPGKEAEEIEMWGDKYSEISGTDRFMLFAVPHDVRALDFRDEPVEELPKGYNIVFWDGQKRLQDGTLEYINSYFKS